MSFFRLWAILRKEFRHIQRDKRTLFLVTLSPAIMLFTFAYLFAFEAERVNIGVWDMDQSALSRRYIASLASDGKLSVVGRPSSYASIYDGMMRGQIALGVVIPPDFESKVNAGQRSPVQLLIDGSDAITVRQSVSRFQQRTVQFSQALAGSSAEGPAIVVQDQAWYNRELKSTFSMVPGLIPIVLILPALAIALALTREKELGSFETLVTTPIEPVEYLIGKLVPYVAYGLVSAVFAILLAVFWFQVPLRGPVSDLLGMTVLYLLALLGESMFIAGLLTSQGTAMRIILLTFFVPSFFLSGVTIPVDIRSGPGKFVSTMMPSTYFVEISRGVFLKEMGIAQLLTPCIYLVAIGLFTFLLSILTFRKQVD
jgi:ABC-2 type transport system permease protein